MSGVKIFERSGGEVIRRKSARISALEEEKRNKACTLDNNNVRQNETQVRRGSSTSKRGRKRKRLEDVGLSSPQDSEDTKDEDYSICNDESAYLSYIQEDPETRILEFILDILQRRDTCNLFAKPVNPQEVWTYHKIIKEPMDFGTIRAKLQEGNYTSLEQFEYDVNLVSANAMHFNASTTVFYQEARAIQELAKQLFQSLRADPEQFQLQFLLTKRGPGRKPQNQGRGSHRRVCRPVGRPSSSRHPYVRIKGMNSNLWDTERRGSYRLSGGDKSMLSVIPDSARTLHCVYNGDYGYTGSLMRFAKDLGPMARRMAENKLAQTSRPEATPPIQSPTYMAHHALPVLALPAAEVPGHLLDGNKGQMHRSSPHHLLNSNSNASYFHVDDSAQGNARSNDSANRRNSNPPSTSQSGMVQNYRDKENARSNDSANRRNSNPPSTSQSGMVQNYRDKGKMVVDLNQNMELVGTGDTDSRTYARNLNSNVRLESHIRVVRDFSSPGTSSSDMKFRAVDMLGKPNPLDNQRQFQQAHQLPSTTGTSNSGILSWAVNELANTSRQEDQQLQPAQLSSPGSSNQSSLLEIMAGRSTYLKPSSSSLRSSSAMLSNLSEASTSWQDFGSQLNNNNAAKPALTGQELQWSQQSAEQNQQESCSFLEMLGDGATFMRNEQQLGDVNCQFWNSTSMRKEQLCNEQSAQWGSSTFRREEEHLADSNFPLDNNTFFRKEQQLNGGNILLGNGTFFREEQQLDAENYHLGSSKCFWKEKQLEEGNFQLGNRTFMSKDQLEEGNLINFQSGNSTYLRTEQQFDQGTILMGKTSFLCKEPQLDRGNLQMGSNIIMSKELQVLHEGNFKQGNTTSMNKKQQLDEVSFLLGKSTCMRTIGEVNPQWWSSTFLNKDQQLGDSYQQLISNSTFLRKEQQLNETSCQYLGKNEQQQPGDMGVMPDWYSAICSGNERATSSSSSSTQWYQKEPIDQSLLSFFLADNQHPNLALQLWPVTESTSYANQ